MLEIWYWILVLLLLVGGVVYGRSQSWPVGWWGGGFVLFLLLVIVGLAVFGSPLK